MRGYATYTRSLLFCKIVKSKPLLIMMNTKNRKLTENKFKPGDARPELVEDWDQVENYSNPFFRGVWLPHLGIDCH